MAAFDAVKRLYAVAIAELVVIFCIDDGFIEDAICIRVELVVILSNVVLDSVESACCCNLK